MKSGFLYKPGRFFHKFIISRNSDNSYFGRKNCWLLLFVFCNGTNNRATLRFHESIHYDFPIRGLPFRGRTSDMTSPRKRALKMFKDRELISEIDDRDSSFWCQASNCSHFDTAWEDIVFPERCIVFEGF
jgi:hypothetical protein